MFFFLWAMQPVALAQPLPQQTGAINDYAATLGGKPQRQPLKQAIDRLQAAHGVSLVVLVSQRDPFNDPARYAAEIRRAWSLPNARNVFVLFLKVNGRWQLDFWWGQDLMTLSTLAGFQQFQSQLQTLTRRGRIRQAALQAADGLLKLLSQPQPSPSSARSNFPWEIAGAGLLGLGALSVAWRWLRSYCPHCARRLERRRRLGKRCFTAPAVGTIVSREGQRIAVFVVF